MKKNLRLLCLGLAAVTFTCSFAQEDKTSLLKNADMEQGLKGWAFDGTDVVGKNTKNPSVKIGFHGMSFGVQEAWHSNAANPLGDSYVMQRLSELPSGTYVFGAYAAAARQYNREDICERNDKGEHVLIENAKGEKIHQYGEWWSNRDSITGVFLFANDATVKVATDNPDLSERNQFFGHSSKFNVAVKLTDADVRKGYLDVGMRTSETNANYIVWDNATLYYFGDMSEADALDAMAEIDMTNAAAIADTLRTYKMNADSLDVLEAAIAAMNDKVSTAATLWDDSELIHQAAGLARKSITDYANLKKNIESAKLLTDPDMAWSQDWTPDLVDVLKDVIDAAQEAYDAAELDRAGLTDLRRELNWAIGDVKVDSVYYVKDYLEDYAYDAEEMINKPGGYTQVQIDRLNALVAEISDTIAVYESELELDLADKKCDPNTLVPYIAAAYEAIKNIEDNPISAEYTKMPIEFKQIADGDFKGWIEGVEWNSTSKQIIAYNSPMYRFPGKIETFRITVQKTKGGNAYFCLSGLVFYDANGNVIPLTEENLSTPYDHNTLNPSSPDGGGIPALFDDNEDTFFHSAWQNSPAGQHYLDVVLPNGGYDAFSFSMLGRANNGYNQSHTFPGEMILSTPMPKRDVLVSILDEAKALNAYSSNEVGYYVNDFSYLLDEIAKVEALLPTYPSEDECDELRKGLERQMNKFKDPLTDRSINLPKAGTEYRIISGFPGFYEKQFVEKALTVNRADSTLWWGNVNADSLVQVFKFEPIPEVDGDPSVPTVEVVTKENSDGSVTETLYYLYTIKNVGTGLYVDSAFVGNKVHMVNQARDTVKLVSLGRGQWNIILNGEIFHAGDHNSGTPLESVGPYGGRYGVGSGICAYPGGLDGASAWYIREYPTLPYAVTVEGTEFKSDCIHFQAANTITLIADNACAFADLALYDFYGNAIEVEDVVVDGNKATITVANNIVECVFAFTNNEGVSSVSFNAFEFTAAVELLQAAYDAAVALAPVEGAGIMQYADLSAYNAALAEAEAMLESGSSDDAAIEAMVKKLEEVTAALEPNMPEAGKYYYIYSALESFESNHGYKMALYTKESLLFWAQENDCEWNRYWQFEPATEDELAAVMGENYDAETNVKAFYIKNVSNGSYIGKVDAQSTQLGMVSSKSQTVPYTFTALEGSIVAIANVNNAGYRLHGAGHGEGKNKSGTVVYWNSGLGTASIWEVVETQFDRTDIDFTEVETEKAVVKGTFDLFGRRVVAPTAPGIYIIDGKKKYIK